MALYIGDELIAGDVEGQKINNPFSLLDYKFSEYELNNASWLLSNGQWNSGAVYQSVYDLLLSIYNGTTTKAGVSVKLSTETYADTDFVINTTDTTFRLPLKVALASGKMIVGNGINLGITSNNSNIAGLSWDNSIGLTLGQSISLPNNAGSSGVSITSGYGLGITTDPLKSGIETSANGLYLYFYVGEVVQDANIIAAGQALTDIADLKSHYIVETYQNGENWYRLYSDGWCEQRIWCSVNGARDNWSYNIGDFQLLKEMKDTTYTVMLWSDQQHTNNGHAVTIGTKTTTDFKLNTYNCDVNGPALIFGYAKEE